MYGTYEALADERRLREQQEERAQAYHKKIRGVRQRVKENLVGNRLRWRYVVLGRGFLRTALRNKESGAALGLAVANYTKTGAYHHLAEIIDFYLTALGKKNLDARSFREEVGEKVLPLLLEMPSKIEEAHFIIEIARKLGVPDTAVWEDVKRLELAADKVAPMREVRAVERKSNDSIKSRRQVAEEEIIGILLWQEGHPEPVIDVVVMRTEYHERIGAHGLTPHEPVPEEKDKLALKAEYKYEHGPKLEVSVDELLDTIEEEVLKEKQAELWQKLSDAEARMAKDEAKEYLKAYQSITPQIIALEDRRIKRGDITTVDVKKPR
jgi:hypothetical protein